MTLPTFPYVLTRAGVVMSPLEGDELEAEGVLNPGSGRGPDGELYLLPRMVAVGNVSRVGLARVIVNDGIPTGVERLGVVLEPDRGWERGADHAGVEDPRVTFIPRLGLHVMTYVAYMESGFPSERVMGMAGVLDTARFRTFLKMELGVSIRDINAMLLGGHGDTMTPLPRFTTIGTQPVTDLIPAERLAEIIDRTKKGGGELVGLMGTSAWYAPGAGAAEMVEAIVKNSGRVLPVAAWVTGQYGLNEMFIGVPVKLGKGGIQETIELALDADEKATMLQSGAAVQELLDAYEAIKNAA